MGLTAFLPNSQIREPLDTLPDFIGKKLKFKILELDEEDDRIILSNKEAVRAQDKESRKVQRGLSKLERVAKCEEQIAKRQLVREEQKAKRQSIISQMKVGDEVVGTVTNIVDYGVFIKIGEVSGLLHSSDISWVKKTPHHKMFNIGDQIKVKILDCVPENDRMSFGLKQLTPSPWEAAIIDFPVGKTIKGKVISIKKANTFVQLADGVVGLLHSSELSWDGRNKRPSRFVKVGDIVEFKVIKNNSKSKEIGLSLKQLQSNPWDDLVLKFPIGTVVECEVKAIVDFGIFMDLGIGIDGFMHISDISDKKISNISEIYKIGDKIKATVVIVDKQTEKFGLGMRQREGEKPQEVAPVNLALIYQSKKLSTENKSFLVDFTETGKDLRFIVEGITFVLPHQV